MVLLEGIGMRSFCREPRNELDAEGNYELEAEHGDKEYDDVAWPNTNSFD